MKQTDTKQNPTPALSPFKVAEEIAKKNGQRNLRGTVQDPARAAPKKGAK